jgi:hypothetical protein
MTAKYNTLSVRILGTQHVKSFSFIMDILYFMKLIYMENQAHQNHRFVTEVQIVHKENKGFLSQMY